MEWTVRIEGNLNQKILVKFDPINEELVFIGQYKPHNKSWVDFSEIRKNLWPNNIVINEISNLISLEVLQETLGECYKSMKKRVEAYEEIAEGFKLITLIGYDDI